MMAATPIYGKTPFKNLPRTGSSMILKFGMQHRGLKLYKVCINGAPGLTLTYLTARANLQLRLYKGKCDIDGFFGIYCIL